MFIELVSPRGFVDPARGGRPYLIFLLKLCALCVLCG